MGDDFELCTFFLEGCSFIWEFLSSGNTVVVGYHNDFGLLMVFLHIIDSFTLILHLHDFSQSTETSSGLFSASKNHATAFEIT